MRANTVLLQFFFLCLICFSAAAKEYPPVWVMDWKSVYPDSIYIAQRGIGKSAELARMDALSAITRYLKSEVQSTLSTSFSTYGKTELTETQQNVFITSQIELYGMEFTTPYRHKRQWYCVAYIDRDKAWNQILPDIRAKEAVFCSFIEKAQNEKEPLRACLDYKTAWNAAQNFFDVLAYGRLINPKADMIFSQNKTLALSIPALFDLQKKEVSVRIVCFEDGDGIIKNALAQKCKQMGFTVSENANTTVTAKIEMNTEGNEPIVVYPELNVALSGKNGETVYSFHCRVEEKTAAYSIETAKRRSLPKLAETVGEEFLQGYEGIRP